jgi:hypothetical protein
LDGHSVANGFVEQLSAQLSGTFFNPFTGVQTATALIGLVPGTTFDVTIGGGFDPLTNPTGVLPETLTAASFEGTDSNGNTILTSLLSSPLTTGTVSIEPTEGGFLIDNSITVNATSFIDGQPRTIAPVIATNTAAPAAKPEPAGMALPMAPLAGLATLRRRV